MIRRGKMKQTKGTTLLFLILGALFTLFPFVWMVLSSFKTFKETMQVPQTILPDAPTLDNYTRVMEKLPIGQLMWNTVIVTVVTTLVTLVIASMGAYAFSRIDFKGKKLLWPLLMAVTMVPGQIFMIPNYTIIAKMGLTDSLAALIIPDVFNVFGVLMLVQFINAIPRSLDEAARIDGANHFTIYRRIILPNIKTPMMSLGIMVALSTWKDVMWPIVINSSISKMTIGAGLTQLQGAYFTENNLMMAAAVLSSLPMIVLFLALQRQFMDSMSRSGVKG